MMLLQPSSTIHSHVTEFWHIL